MFQRIKGAIDSRIAEEQARQKAAQESNSHSRSNSNVLGTHAQADSRSTRLKRHNSATAKGRDTTEFDPDFIVGDDDSSTRNSTPVQMTETGRGGSAGITTDRESGRERTKESRIDFGRGATAPLEEPPQMDLSTEVRVKLRRLDKLEGRYQELLKAYRIAQARVLSIEPFEATLRENTPLTSINDPRALIEYLNQIHLKGDIVLDELKRVTTERDEYKKKFTEVEKSSRDSQEEPVTLISSHVTGPTQGEKVSGKAPPTIEPTSASAEASSLEYAQKSPTLSIASIPGISLFSPRAISVTSPPPVEESEEFFSFDNEIPRLESELEKRQQEVETLKAEVKTLKGDLSVARESTEGMAQSLESATRELTVLREANDRFQFDLENQRSMFEDQISTLKVQLSVAETDVERSSAAIEELKTQLGNRSEKLIQASEKKAEQSVDAAVGEQEKKSDERRLNILQGIVTTLKSQLKDAESTIFSLKADVAAKDSEAKGTQRIVDFVDEGFKDNDAWQTAKQRILDGKTADFEEFRISLIVSNTQPSVASQNTIAAAGGGKKKSKRKKKKDGKDGADEAPQPPIIPKTESPPSPKTSNGIAELEKMIEDLTIQLAGKEAAISRLDSKLKGEEELREEIDSLRDGLRDIGQSCVEAREKVKELLTEKKTLGHTIQELEKELHDLRTQVSSSSRQNEDAHKDLAVEFEELKIKATALQTDLSAAQQLAASRFKDLTILRETLGKIQPELRNLRAESAELKTSKEDLRNKTNELKRLERRHEDLRSEMKNLSGKIGEQEAEIKSLNQRVTQGIASRVKAEQALEVAQSDLRYSEGKKQEAIETNEKTAKTLAKTQEELRSSRTRLLEVEEHTEQLNRDIESLRDELQLKTAQHASAQSLMNSMRDQASEMAMQVKEARERCVSLEEEVADAHRLFSERTRECETMRRLLSDIEMRTDAKVREFKERLEAAIEERDQAEDEASLAGRKRTREIEELRTRTRDMERTLRRVEQDKEELEYAQKEWKRRQGELEVETERSKRDLSDVHATMTHLRDTLDEGERQIRELEKENAELRRSIEATNRRLDKLRKSNRTLTEDGKVSKASKRYGFESSNTGSSRSPRSSLDSDMQQPRSSGLVSPHSQGRSATLQGSDVGGVDYVYLKNVLLQFLEQRDKNYQKQLIPVLGMLLQFDSSDEQKWMSAISSR
ncbi:viral A-type inclusion protein repeat protein [Histoplasma capsulatum G186AR]|uniref:Viral A-type inclusion protein repeat protein n=2 Tax=Ajellomyces capsulatus TaxID=5037 RepID=C0NZ81_AJECG|nr:viral A-type inclusion protein repeat protein [Histoplasma capsulatum G186AR]EEH03521.1 viral A-type inclusion protein repeat protein [Histoplasma capsulatum G186AR]KAG5295934.1 viral A-type inclusion protein repeat protein [Histoplasma capsulatum]QSS73917.1 viral A-type inclusion protein repeat protein [Histoplasma capsulatum G186AR]